MSSSVFANSIADDIGQMLAKALVQKFGKLASPAKALARELDVNPATVRAMFRGKLPQSPTLLLTLDLLGPKLASSVLERVIGKQEANASRLVAMEQSLKELAQHVEEIRTSNSAGRARARALLGLGSGGVAGGEDSRTLGEPRQGSEPSGAAPGIALVSTRLPLAKINPELKRHLSARVVSLADARTLAQADNLRRTGLAYKRAGNDWTLFPAHGNRLFTPSDDPRPVSTFTGDVESLRRDLSEAASSADPIFVRQAGAAMIGGDIVPFNSAVLRIGGRAVCGAVFVLTDFVRVAA